MFMPGTLLHYYLHAADPTALCGYKPSPNWAMDPCNKRTDDRSQVSCAECARLLSGPNPNYPLVKKQLEAERCRFTNGGHDVKEIPGVWECLQCGRRVWVEADGSLGSAPPSWVKR